MALAMAMVMQRNVAWICPPWSVVLPHFRLLGISRAGGAKIAAPLTHELWFRSPVSGQQLSGRPRLRPVVIWTGRDFVRNYLDTLKLSFANIWIRHDSGWSMKRRGANAAHRTDQRSPEYDKCSVICRHSRFPMRFAFWDLAGLRGRSGGGLSDPRTSARPENERSAFILRLNECNEMLRPPQEAAVRLRPSQEAAVRCEVWQTRMRVVGRN